MTRIEQYQSLYNDFLAKNQFQGTPANLYDPMNYIMSIGGKRVRPLLSIIGNQTCTGDINSGIQVGHVMEVFHNFSLVHDDIMDNADLRRGNETVHIKWNMPTAILSGDNMLVKAFELLIHYQGPNKDEILKTFTQTATEVCEGQQNDMDFESMDHVEIDSYLKMIQFKTAVLLGCSLKCGALSANCDIETSNIFYDFAINMGMAFQLMDDYLDTFGQSEATGKLKGGDIIQGKKTWLYLKSKVYNEEKHQELFAISNAADKTQKTIQYWQEIGLDKDCLKLIESYNLKAQEDLKTLESKGYSCNILLELLEYLGSRQS